MAKMLFPIIKPYITKKDEKEVVNVLRSGWLTEGKYVRTIEDRLKKYTGAKYAFLLNSATSGLIVAIEALNLKEKDEVICPSFTFPATSNAVLLAGAKVVFCDVDLDTFNISPDKIESVITKNTKAIMVVHEFGLPAQMDKIMKIAAKHNLHVIEDAACAIGAEFKGKKTGTFSAAGIFSFHPRKIITCGEGGCIVTNSARIAKQIELLRNHGDCNKKFVGCGYNFRLSDVQASLLFNQFKRLEKVIQRRIKLALNYGRLLKPLEDREILRIPACPINYRHVYQSYVVLLSSKISRDKVKLLLSKKGIETQFGTYCVPRIKFYREKFTISKDFYENASFAYKSTLTLPLYHTLKMNEQKFIVEELKKAINKCVE